MRTRTLIELGLASFLLSVPEGCGGGKVETAPKLVPVTGIVRLDQKPVSGVFVVFVPGSNTPGEGGEGRTDKNGRYELVAPGGRAGVAPGEYQVTCAKLVMSDGSDFSPVRHAPPKKQILPLRYSNPKETVLRRTVVSDGGEIDFDLKSR